MKLLGIPLMALVASFAAHAAPGTITNLQTSFINEYSGVYNGSNDIVSLPGTWINPPVLTGSISGSNYHVYSGTMTATDGVPVNVGDLTTSQWARVDAPSYSSSGLGYSLHARSTASGSLEANLATYNDALANLGTAIFVTGPTTPSSVVFHLSIDGIGTGAGGGVNWASNTLDVLGRLDMTVWDVDKTTGTIYQGHGVGSVQAPNDGTPATLDVTVPWSYAYNNELPFSLELVAFARPVTQGTGASGIYIDSDFSNTGSISGITLYDAAGSIITGDSIQDAQVPVSSVPEPPAVITLAIGCVFLTLRKRIWR